jgi:tetratricopeptide (TPR) repeat protein
MRVTYALAIVAVLSVSLWAQPGAINAIRERSRTHYLLGWEHMRAEQFPQAVKEFRQSIEIDPEFEYPYYGLGRAFLAMKRYVEAISAFEQCRDVYQAQMGRQFANARDAQRFREDRLREIDEQIRLQQTVRPQTQGQDSVLRGLQLAQKNMQESLKRGNDMTIENTVPAWLTLSLGSAYFRAGQLLNAEREFKATVAIDSKLGEAHNNLAVVYLELERFDEAAASLQLAKKAGVKVHPDLERAIKNRRK